jgi:probable phosphomutase (TIGR03848 family)
LLGYFPKDDVQEESMPLVLLVRHGENDYVKKKRLAGRQPGVHLNKKGQQQAQAVAERLRSSPIKAVYTSPMERAHETALPIAAALGLQPVVREGLLETDIGNWTGEPIKKVSRLKLWKVVQGAPSLLRFPGGESFAQTQHRIVLELEALCSQHEPDDIFVCVSHADPIKLAVAYYIGLPLDQFQRLALAPASITALHIGEMGSHLLTLNYDLGFTLPAPKPKPEPKQ